MSCEVYINGARRSGSFASRVTIMVLLNCAPPRSARIDSLASNTIDGRDSAAIRRRIVGSLNFRSTDESIVDHTQFAPSQNRVEAATTLPMPTKILLTNDQLI